MGDYMTISSRWETFSDESLPADMSEEQRRQLKRVFYAGFASCMQLEYELGGDEYSEDAAVEIMEGLHSEMHLFADRVQRGEE